MTEIVAGWCLFLPTLDWPGALALAANVALQLVRVRAEERVLGRAFGPEYAGYRMRVPRFLPRLPGSGAGGPTGPADDGVTIGR